MNSKPPHSPSAAPPEPDSPILTVAFAVAHVAATSNCRQARSPREPLKKEGYSSSSFSCSTTASAGERIGTFLPASKSATSFRILSSDIGFEGRPFARWRPGCTVSHLDLTCFFLPFPGVWIPKPSMRTFHGGWKRSMRSDSPRGIQMSSQTRYRHEKSRRSRFLDSWIELACSFNLLRRAFPGPAPSPNPLPNLVDSGDRALKTGLGRSRSSWPRRRSRVAR